MRGRRERQKTIFYAVDLDELVPADHPLRAMKKRVDAELSRMSPVFREAYSDVGRPSVPPEHLLKALLLQALYSIPSERKLAEHIRYNMLFRWFLDLSLESEGFDHATFSKNRERFEEHGLVQRFFDGVVRQAIDEGLASSDHFSVDGTLIQSWASLKSLRPLETKDERVSDGSDDGDPGNPSVNFRGEKRTNETHRSLTDPEARLYRKADAQPAVLCHSGQFLMENRNGLCLEVQVREANGRAERDAVPDLIGVARRRDRVPVETVGMDAGYASGADLVAWENEYGVVPHVPISQRVVRGAHEEAEARRRARRRMRSIGYAISQRVRKRIEEIVGWCKQVGGLKRARHVGRWKIQQCAYIVAAAYNLVRLGNLTSAT